MAERVIEMTEQQTTHRIWAEKKVLKGWNRRAAVGLAFAFILASGLAGSAVWLIADGKTVGGSIIAGIDVSGIAGTFIYGRRDQRDRELRS